jgi:hypothetical protein
MDTLAARAVLRLAAQPAGWDHQPVERGAGRTAESRRFLEGMAAGLAPQDFALCDLDRHGQDSDRDLQ